MRVLPFKFDWVLWRQNPNLAKMSMAVANANASAVDDETPVKATV